MARRLDNLGDLNLRHLGKIYELGNPIKELCFTHKSINYDFSRNILASR